MKTKTIGVVGGTLAVVAIAAAIYQRPLPSFEPENEAPDPVASVEPPVDPIAPEPTPVDPVEEVAAVVELDAEPEPEPQPEVEPEPEQDVAQSEAPAVDPTPAPIVPVMTERRFEPDGALLVAGTAAPGLPVAVTVDRREVERTTADADGAFFIIAFLGFSDTPRVMRLISDPDGNAIPADRTFFLGENPAPVEVVVVPQEPVAEMQDTVILDAPEVAEAVDEPEVAVVPVVEPPETPATPAILTVTEDGVEVVQPSIAGDTPPAVMSMVALDTITYDPDGEVILGGRALGSGFVQVYVDNTPVSRLPVDENGNWRGDLPNVDKGVYTLRIDEVDAEGEVVSRIETPFLREDPADFVDAMVDDFGNPFISLATLTVQPGATLWAIAEERYGSGVLYVNVFEANIDRIRNPDLIYPGQVFTLPDEADN